MTASQHCPHCGNTVKPALTPKRRRRQVENDQYADFLRRAISGYTRRVGQGDIDAIASFSALVAEAGEQLAEAVFLPPRSRLLLDRHQPPARHHPPGRPAALGQHPGMTPRGAAAAIAPEPEHGPGPVATADDVITFADLKTWERQLARTGACSRPVRLRGVSAIDLASGERPVYTRRDRAASSMSRAGTAAKPRARPARRCTSATRGSSSARA